MGKIEKKGLIFIMVLGAMVLIFLLIGCTNQQEKLSMKYNLMSHKAQKECTQHGQIYNLHYLDQDNKFYVQCYHISPLKFFKYLIEEETTVIRD